MDAVKSLLGGLRLPRSITKHEATRLPGAYLAPLCDHHALASRNIGQSCCRCHVQKTVDLCMYRWCTISIGTWDTIMPTLHCKTPIFRATAMFERASHCTAPYRASISTTRNDMSLLPSKCKNNMQPVEPGCICFLLCCLPKAGANTKATRERAKPAVQR